MSEGIQWFQVKTNGGSFANILAKDSENAIELSKKYFGDKKVTSCIPIGTITKGKQRDANF